MSGKQVKTSDTWVSKNINKMLKFELAQFASRYGIIVVVFKNYVKRSRITFTKQNLINLEPTLLPPIPKYLPAHFNLQFLIPIDTQKEPVKSLQATGT